MLVKIKSIAVWWLDWNLVEIEADVSNWMPMFNIVWLWDAAVQESKERVRTAIKNSWFKFPTTRVTINLAPADLKKKWPWFDLAIAIWILWSEFEFSKQIIDGSIILWELSLNWDVRSINSVLPSVIFAKQNWYKYIFIPEDNVLEASMIPQISIVPIKSLRELVRILEWKEKIHVFSKKYKPKLKNSKNTKIDFMSILWQEHAKRALLISAAWWHNLLMQWPPWSWKTMLASAFSWILPEMSLEETIEVSKIYSVAWMLSKETPLITERPFRKIHHTASMISIIWWWRDSKPWEISLAHRWALFLDELLEFDWKTLESLRQPLEDWEITISRINACYRYPAKFMLIWAANPCPCWYLWDKKKECICSAQSIEKYRKKLSWPLLDRIDLHVTIPRVEISDIVKSRKWLSTEDMRTLVQKSRLIQEKRFEIQDISFNSEMQSNDLEMYCKLDPEEEGFMVQASEKLNLSARSYNRLLKISRTIADLDGSEKIMIKHIAEALSFRI